MPRDEKDTRPARYASQERRNSRPERRRPPAQSLSEEIMQIDSDLFALLGRRSILMNKLRKGKSHAATPGVIKSEKQIRSAWEQQAGRLSSSPRLSRQLFGLINELEISAERDEGYSPFNLSPSRQAVRINTIGPSSSLIGRLWLALAASSGLNTRLGCLDRSAPLIETLRAFEQIGVSTRWDGEDLVLDGASLPDYHGKAIFLGDDLLTFYIFVFLGLREPGKLRFTGGPALKEADLSALGRFLPSRGARLISLVPGTKGLPANIECSGDLPDEIAIPSDLPDEAVLALLLGAFTWRKRISISIKEQASYLQKQIIDLAKRAFILVPGLGQAFENSIDYTGYAVSDLDFPALTNVPLDPVTCSVIMVLPIFTGGTVTLTGKWLNCCHADVVVDLFKRFGLEVVGDDVSVSSALLPGVSWPESLEIKQLPPYFHPLFWALNARLAARAGGPILIRQYPEDANLELAEDFMAQGGFRLEEVDGGLRVSAMDSAEFKAVASRSYGWSCPSWSWGLGMSLLAFIRPNLKISNPDCVTRLMPNFWYFYNRLPTPHVRRAGNIDEASLDEPLRPARRRIKTDVVVEPETREDFEGGD